MPGHPHRRRVRRFRAGPIEEVLACHLPASQAVNGRSGTGICWRRRPAWWAEIRAGGEGIPGSGPTYAGTSLGCGSVTGHTNGCRIPEARYCSYDVVHAEAQVPRATAQALRQGNVGLEYMAEE